MAAFEKELVASQVRSGIVPDDWKLFPLARRAALRNALSVGAVGLFALGMTVYLLVSQTAYVPKFLPDSFFSDSGIAAASIVESLLFVALGLWLLIVAARWIQAYNNIHSYFIVVTPDGFVEVRKEKVKGAAFAEIAAIRTRSGFFGLEFIIQRRPGRPFALEVGKNYGPPSEVLTALHTRLRAVQNVDA